MRIVFAVLLVGAMGMFVARRLWRAFSTDDINLALLLVTSANVGLAVVERTLDASPRRSERRSRRLAELEAGAQERFFEERRSLEAYPEASGFSLWKVAVFVVAAMWIGWLLARD